MDEILDVADRVLVMSGGSLVAELDPEHTTKQELMQYSLQTFASKGAE
jgi:ABC-type sugar transport system ATPase subunit